MLTPAPLSGIEALILHPRRERIGREVLREATREALEQISPDSVIKAIDENEANRATFSLGLNKVEVSQDCDPLQLDDLHDILSVDATRAGFPNAETVVNDHQCVTRIVFSAAGGRAALFLTPEEFLWAMSVTSGLVDALSLLMPASAILWKHNGVIMPPERFRMLNSPDLVELLSVRPDFFDGPDTPEGRQTMGLSLFGSEFLIGRRVVFEAAPVPMEYLVEQAIAFLKTCITRNALFPDGDLFGADIREQIRLTYVEPRSPHDVASIQLTVETSTSNDIFPDKATKPVFSFEDDEGTSDRGWSKADEDALDPNDPIDAAILARLREYESSQEDEFAEETMPAPAQMAETVPPPPARPTPDAARVEAPINAAPFPEEFSSKPIVADTQSRAPRTSIAELRRFALENRVPDPTEIKTAGSSSAFGKFGAALSGLLRRKDPS